MISQQTIDLVVQTIVEKLHPEKIVLFGSLAYGSPTEDSDLDLLVVQQSDLPRHKRAQEIRRALDPYPCSMDILVYTPEEVDRFNGHPSAFITEVMKKGKVVYG